MNRLQKKCLIATTGMHLLLLVILVVGPGFFRTQPKPDDLQVLDIIPTQLTDQQFNSGVPKPTLPPPTPKPPTPPQPVPPTPPPPPVPTPEPPKPEVKPVEPTEEPRPEDLTKGDLTPVKPKHQKLKPKPVEDQPEDLLAHKTVKKISTKPVDNSAEENARAERAAKREAQKLARAFQEASQDIARNATSATEVQMPGTSSVSYANYAQAVKSIYDRAWSNPDGATDDRANTVVKIVIASDGTVVSARITTPSGDAAMDASVQQALDRVTEIRPFPEGSTEKTKTFIINFNLKSKRQLG